MYPPPHISAFSDTSADSEIPTNVPITSNYVKTRLELNKQTLRVTHWRPVKKASAKKKKAHLASCDALASCCNCPSLCSSSDILPLISITSHSFSCVGGGVGGGGFFGGPNYINNNQLAISCLLSQSPRTLSPVCVCVCVSMCVCLYICSVLK